MSEIDPTTIAPNAIVGVLAIVGGILILMFRKRLTEFFRRGQKAVLPRGVSRRVQRMPHTSFAVGAVGVIAVGMGISALAFALIGLNHLQAG